MKIIYPILLTALWACATVKVDGVWPPTLPKAPLTAFSEQLALPANKLLSGIADPTDSYESAHTNLNVALNGELRESAERHSRLIEEQVQIQRRNSASVRRIALPSLPRFSARPACG